MKIKMLTVITICCLVPVITGCATSSVSLLEDGTVNLTYEGLWISGDAESAAKQVKSALDKICKGFTKGSTDGPMEEQKAGIALSQVLEADRSLQEAMVELQQATNRRELMTRRIASGTPPQNAADNVREINEKIKEIDEKIKERKAALEAATALYTSQLIAETAGIADQIVKSVKNKTVVVVSSNCKLWSSPV